MAADQAKEFQLTIRMAVPKVINQLQDICRRWCLNVKTDGLMCIDLQWLVDTF